jgi:hypothetical protein
VVEGTVKETRVHSVFVRDPSARTRVADQEDNLPTRFVAITLTVAAAYTRLFARNGEEIDYLENNPRSRGYVAPVLLSHDQLAQRVGAKGTALPDGLIDDRRRSLHPSSPGRFEFWVDQSKSRAKDLRVDAQVRLLTLGNSIFVDSFTFLNAKTNVFKDNEELSGQYADKIMEHAEPDQDEVDTRQGVDEDEWSD